MQDNTIAALAFDLIEKTDKSLFLTGKAGTGKTTFLRNLLQKTKKNHLVVAPTGIAALLAQGATIHATFGFPLSGFIPTSEPCDPNLLHNRPQLVRHLRYPKAKKKLFQALELLIIDEVSMLRADLLDAIDFALRYTRANDHAFGGVQALFIGDLEQLPPIVKNEEKKTLDQYYSSLYFFDSWVIRNRPILQLELDQVYRQKDPVFLKILQQIRENRLEAEQLSQLNARCQSPSGSPIQLCTHNKQVDAINEQQLKQLKSPPKIFTASIHKEFPESLYPAPTQLTLKIGAQVVFIRNDYSEEKRYYNGKIARVAAFNNNRIGVNMDDSPTVVWIEPVVWENTQATIHPQTGAIEPQLLGTFTQYPLRLAWAISIHKSQGMSFDSAYIDVSQSFAPGQIYVALSRCTTLERLYLKHPIHPHQLQENSTVRNFQAQRLSLDQITNFVTQTAGHYAVQRLVHLLECYDVQELLKCWTEAPAEEETLPDWQAKLLELEQVSQRFIRKLIQSDVVALQAQAQRGVDYLCQHFYACYAALIDWLSYHEINDYHQRVQAATAGLFRHIDQLQHIFWADTLLSTVQYNALTLPANTYEQTAYLLQKGLPPEEIAEKRRLTVGSIYRHIAQLIQWGQAALEDFVSQKKIKRIQQLLAKAPADTPLVTLKNMLGDSYSYEEIRLVQAHNNRPIVG